MKPSNHDNGRIDSSAAPSLASGETETLQVIALLADSLQALESQPGCIDADEYDFLVAQLKTEMSRIDMNRKYRTILSRYPAAAELYENLHYEAQGLCMRSNEHAVSAERIAVDLIELCSEEID